MKRLLLLITFLSAISGFSQIIVLLDEDFDANTIPAGWIDTNYNVGNGTQPWTFGSRVMPGNTNYHVDNFPNNAAIFNDDAAGAGHHDIRALISPYIDAHLYTNATLKLRYQYALNNKAAGGNNHFHDDLFVVIQDNPGHAVEVSRHSQTTDPVYHWVDVAQALRDHPEINASHFRVYWIFDDHDSSFGWGCGIDDVAMTVHPDNDDCAHAVQIASLPYLTSQNAVGATNNNGFITPSGCGLGMNDGVWYTFTPTTSGTINISVGPTGWDAEVAVYTGSCGNFTCVANADDPETINDMPVTAGTQYFINIGYFSYSTDGQEGLFSLGISAVTAGISQSNSIKGFELYPNPANDVLHLKAEQEINQTGVYNMLGQKVLQNNPNQIQLDLNISNLASGTYILKIQSGNQLGSYHFIKK